MGKFGRGLPSPAMVVALAALFVALGGTGYAAGKAILAHKDAKADTKLVKQLAPSLSVKHAASADSATNATSALSPGTLASGKTEIGGEAEGVATAGGQSFASDTASFPFPLASAPTAHFVSSPTAACPGSAANPSAQPGNLCVYFAGGSNVSAVTIYKDAGAGTGADRMGFSAVPTSTASGAGYVYGTWAVTAP
jgi:hypothetical protein